MAAITWQLTRARRRAATVSLAVLGTWLQACATHSSDRTDRQVARAVMALERQHDADSLAAAALLSSSLLGRDQNRAASLIARATVAAPDRADLAWLQTMICQETSGCDSQPFEATVRRLDPSNGAGWLGALARASAAKDDMAAN